MYVYIYIYIHKPPHLPFQKENKSGFVAACNDSEPACARSFPAKVKKSGTAKEYRCDGSFRELLRGWAVCDAGSQRV